MQINFNAQQIAPQQPFEPIPVGWYPGMLKTLEPKETKAQDGSWMLAGEIEVIDGQYRGRKVFLNLNLGNKNPQAVEIAQRELSALCHVTGQYVIQDTNQLLNIPFQFKVDVEGSNNRIKGYKDQYGNDPGKQGQGQQNAQPAPAAMPPAAAPQGAWGAQPPAAAPMAAPAPAYAPPAAAPAAWGQPPAAQPHPTMPQGGAPWGAGAGAPAAAAPQQGAPAWGGGAPAPAAQPPAAAAPAAAWAPPAGGAPAGGPAPWAR